ncbi:MAG: peptidase U32 family protein [Endomicrobiales bacterium]
MELLAPVGSKESFITALRGGADAVYAGVPDFNARVSASNISLYDLQVLIDHAHGKGKKVFLALNTLIKHEEMHDVVKNIARVEQMAPDAVIVQDLGAASIILKYFPSLELHASTQMAVHNRQGVDFLARAGFKRAILARELSFSELKMITKGSPIPIEVFCHGALCFSLSGMCLFSSFIGGLSGNRGRCTQPCRRLWRHGKSGRGYLFSPRDLELAEHINKLKKIGIACLKIEGRMRSSEYVYRAVKAYRLLIDAPEPEFALALEEAKAILSGDTARSKTSCLFSGRDTEIFQPKEAQCLGNLVGRIQAIAEGSIVVEPEGGAVELAAGDRLRLSNPANDTTIAFKVKEFSKEGETWVIPFGKTEGFAPGNPV